MDTYNNKKPKKLLELEEGNYKSVRVTAKLKPYTYRSMILHMEQLGINKESDYISMSVTLMNQSRSGNKE